MTKPYTQSALNVVGGYHATARPDDFTDADFVIKGDGEQSIIDILEGRKPSSELQRTDINAITKPDRSLLMMEDYQMKQNGKRTATLISSRGCPFSCIFCGNYDRQVRFRSSDNVGKEIEELKEMGFDALYFLDDAFTVSKTHAIEVSQFAKIYDMPFRITTRATLLDESVIEELALNGLEIASLGIESGSAESLKAVDKKMTPEDNLKAVRLLHKYGVDTKGFFMFGLPKETPSRAEETIEFAKMLKGEGMSTADFYAMTPFPGTPIYENPKEFGCTILSHNWSKYLEVGKEEVEPVLETDCMTASQIKHFVERAKEEFQRA